MPEVGIPFSPIEFGEADILSISFGSTAWVPINQPCVRTVFARKLAAGETITNVYWGCAAIIGTDPDAEDCLGTQTNTDTVASVLCTGFLAGVTYVIEAAVRTSLGKILKVSSPIFCIQSPFPLLPTPSAGALLLETGGYLLSGPGSRILLGGA